MFLWSYRAFPYPSIRSRKCMILEQMQMKINRNIHSTEIHIDQEMYSLSRKYSSEFHEKFNSLLPD